MKAAILDMDGLMFDTEKIYDFGWKRAGDVFGYPLPYEKRIHLKGANAPIQIVFFQKWFGDDVPFYDIKDECDRYTVEYLNTHEIPLKKGLFELLEALKEKGYKIAVATGSKRCHAPAWWEKTGVAPYLDVTVCGDEVSKGKPDPEIFLTAAEKIGVAIEDCFVLEDSFNGIRSAKTAGATTILIPDMDEPSAEVIPLCDYILEDMTKVIELL